MKKRILFRCDGGDIPEIGMGHVARCLVLADDLKKRKDTEVLFLMKDYKKGIKKVEASGYRVAVIKKSEDEALRTVKTIFDFMADIVVVDRLSTSAKYTGLIKKSGVILIAVDDIGEGRAFADITINPILATGEGLYEGFDYMVLPGRKRKDKAYKKECRDIFVSFGGFDCNNITEKVLPALKELDIDSNFHIVASNIDTLKKIAADKKNIHLYSEPEDFSGILNKSGLAVVSGGLTLLQAVASGVPTLVISQYEHQLGTAKRLDALGTAVNLGMHKKLNTSLLTSKLNELAGDHKLRSKMGLRGRDLMDGLGNTRVSNLIGIVDKLEWDSNFWRMNIASLYPMRIKEDIVKFAFEKCKEDNIDCLFYLCDCHDPRSVQLAEKYGFHFVDVRITFERSLRDKALENSPVCNGINDSIRIREAKVSDAEHLREIAQKSYIQSRYFFDRHFPVDLCKKFYSDWITKSIKGEYDDIVLVAQEDSKVVGYISCRIDSSNLGTIGLVGVSSGSQGKNVGVALIEAAMEWFSKKDIFKIRVVTQGRNIPAQRLYQKSKFKLARTELWYHKWFARDYQLLSSKGEVSE